MNGGGQAGDAGDLLIDSQKGVRDRRRVENICDLLITIV